MTDSTEDTVTRRGFLAATAATSMAAAGVARAADEVKENVIGLATSSTDAETVARMKVTSTAKISALQFTDVHFFCTPMLPKRDKQTLEDLPRLVDLAKPDILLVTGDLWHDNPEGRGEEYMQYAVEQIASLGVPWLFLWGNHDQLNDYAKGHDYLRQAKHSLYRGGPGGGNYRVEIEDGGGEVAWEFLCLNSSDLGLMDTQQEWLTALADERKGTKPPPSATLVHIPLKQHLEAWESGEATGVKLEGVSHWEEDGSSLAALRAASDVRGVFCGHDHVNDYAGMVDGVEMVFGHATGTGGYGGNKMPKGAKLIEIDAGAESYTWETLLPDGTRWKPKETLRSETLETSPFGDPKKYYKAKHKKRDA